MIELSKEYDCAATEAQLIAFWEDNQLYAFNPDSQKPIFSIDTPPPYVSAAHLHVGHAMSYSQAEFIIRYKRMQGFEIFYPMGFDDNGLPTERFVENTYQIDKRKISRADFRALCLSETQKGRQIYEKLWKNLGLSVDWRLGYSTIDDHCCRTAQASFIDLYHKQEVYRSEAPVLWDTHFETALAQADLEPLTRRTTLHDIEFQSEAGEKLVISTTRPEMLPACVALFYHPEDPRYQVLANQYARVPLFGHRVPILASLEVQREFGTGLMMVCTFGDGKDVEKWKLHQLETRICLTTRGRLNALGGAYEGLTVEQARSQIVKELSAQGLIQQSKSIEQTISVCERSQVPVEFQLKSQWLIKILDKKEILLKRSAELAWHPDWMKIRLDQWIEGLKYDWNISRQRFYGVPFPVWYCAQCQSAVVASVDQLPIDPTESPCPEKKCRHCGHTEFLPETDVMDTWMTSSLTPLINSNWVQSPKILGTQFLLPFSLRVQAFEIIRTWLFYTLLKSELHQQALPWKAVMISGWGLNEQGKKISKRELEKFTDASGYNPYDPDSVIRKYGADALRHWASTSHLGYDLKFFEKEVKTGQRLVIKLWNAARFCLLQMTDFAAEGPKPLFQDRTPEDRWLLIELHKTIEKVTEGFESYDYAMGTEALNRFFWHIFCDNYLEMIKDRFWHPERHSLADRLSTQSTLWESLRILLGLFAPYLPFVTESLYQHVYRRYEETSSIHISTWPDVNAEWLTHSVPEMDLLFAILQTLRALRTQQNLPQTKQIRGLVLDVAAVEPHTVQLLQSLESSLVSVARVETLRYDTAHHECDIPGLKMRLVVE